MSLEKSPVQVTGDVAASSNEYSSPGDLLYTGRAIIICNTEFSPTAEVDDRPVAARDVQRLNETLKAAGFNVTVHWNKTAVKMTRILQDVAREDLSKVGCLLCVFSTHGTWDNEYDRDKITGFADVIYGTDAPTPLEVLLSTVRPTHAPGLDGKPKIFLLQNCRGEQFVANIDVTEVDGDVTGATEHRTFTGAKVRRLSSSDAPEDYDLTYQQPVKRDFFLHYSTVPGHLAFKQFGLGTPFLQAWSDVLSEAGGSRDIHDLATIVNAKVAQDYQSNAPSKADKGRHQRKQMPQIISMLTKDFYIPVLSSI